MSPSQSKHDRELWLPPIITGVVSVAPTLALPQRYHLLPPFVTESLAGFIVVTSVIAMFLGWRGKRASLVRLIGLLVALNTSLSLFAFGSLLSVIFQAGPGLRGQSLLGSASIVWLSNVSFFALLFWYLDAVLADKQPEVLFPELGLEDRKGWRPNFLDYVFVSLTTALAFGPSDSPPASTRMRLAMITEAIVSFVTIGLVVARALNALG